MMNDCNFFRNIKVFLKLTEEKEKMKNRKGRKEGKERWEERMYGKKFPKLLRKNDCMEKN